LGFKENLSEAVRRAISGAAERIKALLPGDKLFDSAAL
jgi:hypothetical protein